MSTTTASAPVRAGVMPRAAAASGWYGGPMRSTRPWDRSFYLGTHRVPAAVAVLIGLTLLFTIVGAVGTRNGVPLLEAAALVPALVWAGQAWRLLTWVFVETQALSLVFGCLALWFLGRDLVSTWGPGRFLGVFLVLTAATGAATTLLALLFSDLRVFPFLGMWPLVDALIIAWGLLFPGRQILIYFVIPVQGRALVPVTVGGTVLFALLYGLVPFIPHFLAEGLMLAWLYSPDLRAQIRTRFRRRSAGPRRVESWSSQEKPGW